MDRKNILFITPVLPSLQRRGRNFRAYQWIWRLQKEYQVFVVCTSVYGKREFEDDKSIQKLNCEIYSPEHKYSTFERLMNLVRFKPSTWNEAGLEIEKKIKSWEIPEPDLLLCFRIQNASTALYISQTLDIPEVWLDIDEVDSRVKYNIANQMMEEGYVFKGMKEKVEASMYAIQENKFVPEFDTVFTSTTEEQKNLQQSDLATHTEVFGNMLPELNDYKLTTEAKGSFTFMFVGDCNYFPNLDAINYLLFDIIPGLEKMTTNFRFIIIGGFLGRRQHQQINRLDSVVYYQDVEDLRSIYDQTHAVIVPLRAGGGSSLKFLEALRFKKPVVATSVGARGFDVKNGVQALIGDSSTEIKRHCLSLIDNRELSKELAENGHAWFVENHSFNFQLISKTI